MLSELAEARARTRELESEALRRSVAEANVRHAFVVEAASRGLAPSAAVGLIDPEMFVLDSEQQPLNTKEVVDRFEPYLARVMAEKRDAARRAQLAALRPTGGPPRLIRGPSREEMRQARIRNGRRSSDGVWMSST